MGYEILQEIKNRNLPDVLKSETGINATDHESWRVRRDEIKKLLTREFCGYMPQFPCETEGFIAKEDKDGYGGKAVVQTLEIRVRSPFSYFSFPVQLCIPKNVENPPVFVFLSFTPTIADGLGEEILDNGYAIANLYYQDVAADKEDNYLSGAGRFCTRNPYDSWGKLSMWAWGASRIMDYLLLREDVDFGRVAIMGHSRLGKAALICGAMDERFSIVVSNDSGGGGAALFRGKTGEGIANLAKPGSHCWFSENFFKNHQTAEELEFDQHFLLALAAPRKLYVCSATRDEWADPASEFLACVAASPVYEILGRKGLIYHGEYPKADTALHEGSIGYHMREGTHHLGRYDWQQIIAYRRKHDV